MIVQCPSCASRYRVNEANIPSSGGRIRCPSCEHAFVVYPEPQPSFEDDADDKTSVIMSPDLHEMMAKHQNRFKSTPAPVVEQEEEEEAMTEVMDPSEIPAMAGAYDEGRFGQQSAAVVDDHTVEMRSPDILSHGIPNFKNTSIHQPDDGQTTELTSDALRKGLQAAAAARAIAAKTGGSAPPPPMPDARTSRMSADVISKNLPAAPRPSQATPHAAPHTLQKVGQRPPQPSFGKLPAIESKSKSGIRFPSEPAGGRSFGEEPVSRTPAPPVARPGLMDGLPPRPGLGDDDATGVNMMAPVIVSNPGEPDPNHVGPWHLRTNFGLTYEFPDTKGLRSWLSNRDELEGVTLSADGKEFFELSRFPQVQSGAQTGGMPAIPGGMQAASTGVPNQATGAAPGFGAASQNAPSNVGFGAQQQRLSSTPFSTADGQPVAQDAGFGPNQPVSAPSVPDPATRIAPESHQASGGSKMGLILWPILAVLLVIAGVLVLQTLGVVDLKPALLGTEPQPAGEALIAEVGEKQEDTKDLEEVMREREAAREREARMRDQLERIVLTAEEDIVDNRLQIASEKLKTAKTLDPKNIRVHEMLVDVYTRLGQEELADDVREALEDIRENPLPPADE